MRDPNPKGDIWVYGFDKKSSPSPQRVQLDGFPATSDFHPLGIDILPATSTEPAHLFITNHGRNFSTVEQFKLFDGESAPYRAQYIRTWTHQKAIHAPNAVVPLSPTSFYVTNDHTLTRRLPSPWNEILPLIETVLVVPGGWVDRLDWVEGEIKVTRAVSGIAFANGIAMSPDGSEVAVASTTGGTVQLYDRDKSTNVLKFREQVFVPFTPDNVAYDEKKGSIIVAGHPHFPSLLEVVAKKATTAPSWVLEIEKRKDTASGERKGDAAAPYPVYQRVSQMSNPTYDVTTLYQSDGEHFGFSTTGVQHGKHLFVSGLYQEGVLHCVASA